jgi:hypothetical protein
MILRINSDYFLNQVIFVMDTRCVIFEVGTEFLEKKTQTSFVFEGLIGISEP